MLHIDSRFVNTGVKSGLTIVESIVLFFLAKGAPMKDGFEDLTLDFVFKSLVEKGILSIREDLISSSEVLSSGDYSKAVTISSKAKALFRIHESGNVELAATLREMFPPGMKNDRWPWRGTPSMICKRLNEFNELYPDITSEEIILATRSYLSKFNTDESRSLLAYFIWKEKNDGSKNKVSILASFVYAMRDLKKIDSGLPSNVIQL